MVCCPFSIYKLTQHKNIIKCLSRHSHVTVENGELVTYLSDAEVDQELVKQGLKESKASSNEMVTEAAKKGGVTKGTYGKNGTMNLYLSHAATTNLLRVGTVGSAAFLGAIISGPGAGAISNFAHSVIGIYAGKAVPKNGIIVKGKVDGSVSRIVAQ